MNDTFYDLSYGQIQHYVESYARHMEYENSAVKEYITGYCVIKMIQKCYFQAKFTPDRHRRVIDKPLDDTSLLYNVVANYNQEG